MSDKDDYLHQDPPQHIIDSIYQEVDGYRYFWPKDGGGYFGPHHLRQIDNYLDKVNKPYDDQLMEYHKKEAEQ